MLVWLSGSFWLVSFFSVLLVFSAFGFFAFVSGFSVGSFWSVWFFWFFRPFGFLRSVWVFLLVFSVVLVLFGRFGPLRRRRFFVVPPYVSNIDLPLSRFNDSN